MITKETISITKRILTLMHDNNMELNDVAEAIDEDIITTFEMILIGSTFVLNKLNDVIYQRNREAEKEANAVEVNTNAFYNAILTELDDVRERYVDYNDDIAIGLTLAVNCVHEAYIKIKGGK